MSTDSSSCLLRLAVRCTRTHRCTHAWNSFQIRPGMVKSECPWKGMPQDTPAVSFSDFTLLEIQKKHTDCIPPCYDYVTLIASELVNYSVPPQKLKTKLNHPTLMPATLSKPLCLESIHFQKELLFTVGERFQMAAFTSKTRTSLTLNQM